MTECNYCNDHFGFPHEHEIVDGVQTPVMCCSLCVSFSHPINMQTDKNGALMAICSDCVYDTQTSDARLRCAACLEFLPKKEFRFKISVAMPRMIIDVDICMTCELYGASLAYYHLNPFMTVPDIRNVVSASRVQLAESRRQLNRIIKRYLGEDVPIIVIEYLY